MEVFGRIMLVIMVAIIVVTMVMTFATVESSEVFEASVMVVRVHHRPMAVVPVSTNNGLTPIAIYDEYETVVEYENRRYTLSTREAYEYAENLVGKEVVANIVKSELSNGRTTINIKGFVEA